MEISWFSALCDDDFAHLGVAAPDLLSSFDHCSKIALASERNGFDSILLPSGYSLGIDNWTFGAAVAKITSALRLLLAIRVGEVQVGALARMVASLDQMASGRLDINIISSDLPGEVLASDHRYRRTLELMFCLRELLSGQAFEYSGEFFTIKAPARRIRPVGDRRIPFYFGGLSQEAKRCAARGADVYLMWPDTVEVVKANIDELRNLAAGYGRNLSFGWRSHVIVRETATQAREAARDLMRFVDDSTGAELRGRALDSASVGVARQSELRDAADEQGYADELLFTGIGRARSGAGAALVGDPDQIVNRITELSRLGIDAFIFSGYPHLAECDLFGRYVMPRLEHRALVHSPSPIAL